MKKNINELQELENKIIEVLDIYKMAPDLIGQYLSEAESMWTEEHTLKEFLSLPNVQLTTPTANRWMNI